MCAAYDTPRHARGCSQIVSPDQKVVARQLSRLAHTFAPLVEDPRSFVRRLMKTVSKSLPLRTSTPSGGAKATASKGLRRRGGTGGDVHSTTNPAHGQLSSRRGSARSSVGTEGAAPVVNISDSLAVVVTGEALRHILGHRRQEKHFLTVARLCKSVIACRVSPAQKAEVVRLVRRNTRPKPMCLAIGDGANDVNMIQAAQVRALPCEL